MQNFLLIRLIHSENMPKLFLTVKPKCINTQSENVDKKLKQRGIIIVKALEIHVKQSSEQVRKKI